MKSDSSPTMPALGSDVIARAQKGDAEAFAVIFDAHKTRVYSLCFRMTNNTAEAEDLAQEAFMQVFRKLATFRGDSAFSTWLYRITVNTVLMHFRRKSLQRVSLDDPGRLGLHRAVDQFQQPRNLRLGDEFRRTARQAAVVEVAPPAGFRKT